MQTLSLQGLKRSWSLPVGIKKSIEDHFDKSVELELELEHKGKYELLAEVRAISDMVNIHYIRQKEPKGLGHAIYCAKSFIGNLI